MSKLPMLYWTKKGPGLYIYDDCTTTLEVKYDYNNTFTLYLQSDYASNGRGGCSTKFEIPAEILKDALGIKVLHTYIATDFPIGTKFKKHNFVFDTSFLFNHFLISKCIL